MDCRGLHSSTNLPPGSLNGYKFQGKTAVLKPLNPNYDDIVLTEEIQIIGRVIRKIKRY